MASSIKKKKEQLELLINIDILLMVEKGIRTRKCYATNQYLETNNIYTKYHDKNIPVISHVLKWE